MEFRAIILRIIWRLAPALWLDWATRRLIDWAIATLNDQQDWLNAHPRTCFWFGGWLTVIEATLDELIDLKAHLLLNRRCEPRDVPAHFPTPAVRSIDDCLLRLARLVQRFEDSDRLAERRAETLLRLSDDSVIHLIPDHRPAISSSSSSSSRNSIATGAAVSRRTASSSSSI